MQKNNALPNPIGGLVKQSSECSVEKTIPSLISNLSLDDREQKAFINVGESAGQRKQMKNRIADNQKVVSKFKIGRIKPIQKIRNKNNYLKRSYKKKNIEKVNYKKKAQQLAQKLEQIEQQILRLKKRMQCCIECRHYIYKNQNSQNILDNSIRDNIQSYKPNYEQEMKKIAGGLNQSKGSMGSLQFQNVDFQVPVMFAKQLDDKAWIYIGTLMIAMGSKCIQVDGTINIFRILKQSVDTLRRQVQKSKLDVSLDFYMTQQQMKQTNNNFGMMQQIGFDPFTQKIGGDTGLSLQGIKIESVEQFELLYDNKITYNVKYEALLGAMEYLRQNSWLTF